MARTWACCVLKAESADGTYKVSGTKIFISVGEHDMAGNIVHIVLARSARCTGWHQRYFLFIVPKFTAAADGMLATHRSPVGLIDTGRHHAGNATCVMNL
jgi:alkylation response protein AidB-like acyl-CoA dehydrogenase